MRRTLSATVVPLAVLLGCSSSAPLHQEKGSHQIDSPSLPSHEATYQDQIEEDAKPLPPPVHSPPDARARLQKLRVDARDGIALSDHFPDDIPLYPGSRVIASGREKGRYLVNLQTEEHTDHVWAFYQRELPQRGWVMTPREVPGLLIEAHRGNRTCMMTIMTNPEGESTIISISVTPKEERSPDGEKNTEVDQ